jgi:hypothetical protein
MTMPVNLSATGRERDRPGEEHGKHG